MVIIGSGVVELVVWDAWRDATPSDWQAMGLRRPKTYDAYLRLLQAGTVPAGPVHKLMVGAEVPQPRFFLPLKKDVQEWMPVTQVQAPDLSEPGRSQYQTKVLQVLQGSTPEGFWNGDFQINRDKPNVKLQGNLQITFDWPNNALLDWTWVQAAKAMVVGRMRSTQGATPPIPDFEFVGQGVSGWRTFVVPLTGLVDASDPVTWNVTIPTPITVSALHLFIYLPEATD